MFIWLSGYRRRFPLRASLQKRKKKSRTKTEPKYLKRYYCQHPDIYKVEELMNTKQPTKIKNLCVFIDNIMKAVN